MADALQMMTGIRPYVSTPVFALLILGLLVWTSYRTMAKAFKWLTLVLFAYNIAAFLARPNWKSALNYTFTPHVEWNKTYLSVLVAILGTTQAAEALRPLAGRGRIGSSLLGW